MIVTRLYGGLGNQIFQLGASLLFAEKICTRDIYLYEKGLSKYETKRNNNLNLFFEIKNSSIEYLDKKSILMDYRIPKIFSFNFPFNFFIGDNNFKYSNYQNNLPRILYLDGYFQHCLEQETFNAIKLLLLQIKKNNPHNLYCHIKSQAVIHIRGGDFLKLNWNTVASKKYYLDAMKFMQKNHRVEKFIVVTDDRAYSDTILNKSEFFIEYSNGNLEEDFYLIGSHDKRILSNSTFSLWASELGRNSEETLVIAPKLWTPNKKRIIKLTKEININ